MLVLQHLTWLLRRLRFFQMVHSRWAPSGSLSTAVIFMAGVVLFRALKELRRRQVRVWEAESLRRPVEEMKLLPECRCDVSGVCWNMGWRGEFCCLTCSDWLAAALLMPGGAIPSRMCRWSVLVGFRHPVMIWQHSLRVLSSLLKCFECSQTGQAYSAAE